MLAFVLALSSYVFPHNVDTTSIDTTMYIREIVIDKQKTKSLSPSQKFNAAQINKISNNNVAEALRFFSGIQVKDYGGIGGMKTVNLRSLGSQHLGISYDGILLGNAQNGQIDLGQFSLDNIDEIALYNGQNNTILMTASDYQNAGAIFIKTRKPVFNDNKPYNLSIRTKAGSFDTYYLSALYEQKISNNVSSSLNAEAITSTGKYKFRYRDAAYDTTATRQNGDIKSFRAEANLYFNVNEAYGSLKLYTYHSRRGIPGAITSNVWARGERQADHNTFIQGNIQKQFSRKFTSKIMAKYSYYNTKYVNNDTTRMLINNKYRQQEFYISTSNRYNIIPTWSVSVSYDFKWNKLNANTINFAYPERFNNLVSISSLLDIYRFKIQGSLLATFIKDKTKKSGDSDGTSNFSPALFINWQPSDNNPWSIRAFAKKSFRMPTFNDLYYVDIGNAKLKPETATQYNIGIAYEKGWNDKLFKQISIQADAYYNTIEDKILAYPKGTQFRWTMMNLGKVNIHGLDVTAKTSISPATDLTINAYLQYTWQDAVDVTNPKQSYYKNQLPYTPKHSGSCIISINYKDIELSYSSMYSGIKYCQQENIRRNKMHSIYTSDISITKSMKINNNSLRIKGEIINLFNKEYEIVKNFPMPMRNYSISLNYTL